MIVRQGLRAALAARRLRHRLLQMLPSRHRGPRYQGLSGRAVRTRPSPRRARDRESVANHRSPKSDLWPAVCIEPTRVLHRSCAVVERSPFKKLHLCERSVESIPGFPCSKCCSSRLLIDCQGERSQVIPDTHAAALNSASWRHERFRFALVAPSSLKYHNENPDEAGHGRAEHDGYGVRHSGSLAISVLGASTERSMA